MEYIFECILRFLKGDNNMSNQDFLVAVVSIFVFIGLFAAFGLIYKKYFSNKK